jgi:xanthine dehydrogenase YagR molybdenum-binding subunit
MAQITYSWPSRERSKYIGKEITRLDGVVKSTGLAKYAYDIVRPNMLLCRGLGSPHAHARVASIDVAAARQIPGVVDIEVVRQPGYEINWQGDLLAIVAAESEGAAAEGVAAIRVEYEQLPVFITAENIEAAEAFGGITSPGGGRENLQNEPPAGADEDAFVEAEIQRLFGQAAHVVEGMYGIDMITHCCLETHGATVYWEGDKLIVYLSTQNVSGTPNQFTMENYGGLQITSDDIEVICDYVGGGFGSKFQADFWAVAAAQIARRTGRPVKFLVSRDIDQKIAGSRPSAYVRAKVGADENGVLTVWDGRQWGSPGAARGGGVNQNNLPYVIVPPNVRHSATNVFTHAGTQRAWRAPGHPQACAISQTAVDDIAAKMRADSFEVFKANLANVQVSGDLNMRDVYTAEMDIAAGLMDWKAKWHPHGQGTANGAVVDGLGMALHTWGGAAGNSACRLRIHPDGAVETFCGTQDLGTGTRTVCAMVVAETFGLPLEAIKVNIGRSSYPNSSASGGSTTVGGVSESHRRASQNALAQLAQRVAAQLEVPAASLEAVDGVVRSTQDATKSMSWVEACSLLGMTPLEVTVGFSRGQFPDTPLSSLQVGGVQMAHVSVDRETGVVKMNKFVAVQDIGLVVNRTLATSQINGAVIMSIAYSLFEQRINDPQTGAFLNAELSEYKLPRLGDIPEIVVEFYEPDEIRNRGVIGLGEPPVISGGAAISNAVANALGFRVPVLPMTPQRVLDAINLNAGRA